jgi:cytochrome P450
MANTLTLTQAHKQQAEGHDWQRQRKLTAAPFNEQKSPLVWGESLRQANHMLKSWCSPKPSGFTTTPDDTRTLALDVLAYVAFQKSYPFESISHAEVHGASSLTYRDSISIILENALVIMVLPEAAFSSSSFPRKWQQIGWAIKKFRDHMSNQAEDERRLMQSGMPGTGSLVSNLVRASDETGNKMGESSDDQALKSLSKAEILGNIFVFNFAGHDTTAISLSYGMLLLVAHPEVQDWVHEELRYYVGDCDLSTLNYSDVFPKLKRCLAVLVCMIRKASLDECPLTRSLA